MCRSEMACRFESYTLRYAVCPGGEGAVLKTVGFKRLAGSNPVHSAEEREIFSHGCPFSR